MAESSMLVFNADPHAANNISPAEEALVRTLFANFEIAWNHPAVQDRLRRARQQPSSNSILNGMTLFCAIWNASKPPEFRSYKHIWHAMREYLENGGVLAAVVSKFNAYATRNGKRDRTSVAGKSEAWNLLTTSNAWEDVGPGYRQIKRSRSPKSSPNPYLSDRVSPELESFVNEPSPTPPARFIQEDDFLVNSPSSPHHILQSRECSSYLEGEQSHDQRRTFHSSNLQHSYFHPHPSLSHSAEAWAQTQIISNAIDHPQVLVAGTGPYSYPTHSMDECLQLPEQYLTSLASPINFPRAPETRQDIAVFGAASSPSSPAFHDHRTQFPQLDSYSIGRQAHQTTTVPLPYSSSPTTSYSSDAALPHQSGYLRGYTDGEFHNEYERNAYNSTQNWGEYGYGGVYMQPATCHGFK